MCHAPLASASACIALPEHVNMLCVVLPVPVFRKGNSYYMFLSHVCAVVTPDHCGKNSLLSRTEWTNGWPGPGFHTCGKKQLWQLAGDMSGGWIKCVKMLETNFMLECRHARPFGCLTQVSLSHTTY